MKLNAIQVENYKSIEKEKIVLEVINESFTYTLIGINESGKSSFLNAISLKDTVVPIPSQDFNDRSEPIIISFDYEIEDCEINQIREKLKNENNFPDDLLGRIVVNRVILKKIFESPQSEPIMAIEVFLNEDIFEKYTLIGNSLEEKENITAEGENHDSFSLKKHLENNFSSTFSDFSHNVIFWKSEDKYLINNPIDLDAFSQEPQNVSIPLKNCFELAGIPAVDIANQVATIKGNHAETKNLIEKLEDSVTQHVRRVWPDHPINIKFNIDGVMLSLLVEDDGVRYKAKTTSQRSDGFRQFISFLLTISAQNNNDKLSDSLLLIDEPETHLHPKGQENLRDELIKITKGKLNNVVIFATHSNYMIDKNNLERCRRVLKEGNKTTKIVPFSSQSSSYSEINYIVFDVATNDYHNELYGFLESEDNDALNSLEKDKVWNNEKNGKKERVSLATYMRHSIHHPENTSNKKFTQGELIKSIKILRELKYGR